MYAKIWLYCYIELLLNHISSIICCLVWDGLDNKLANKNFKKFKIAPLGAHLWNNLPSNMRFIRS